MRRTTRRSLLIYLAGFVVLAFFAIMALVEANERGRNLQYTMTAINLTNTHVSRIFMQRTNAAFTMTYTPMRSLTATPTARK